MMAITMFNKRNANNKITKFITEIICFLQIENTGKRVRIYW